MHEPAKDKDEQELGDEEARDGHCEGRDEGHHPPEHFFALQRDRVPCARRRDSRRPGVEPQVGCSHDGDQVAQEEKPVRGANITIEKDTMVIKTSFAAVANVAVARSWIRSHAAHVAKQERLPAGASDPITIAVCNNDATLRGLKPRGLVASIAVRKQHCTHSTVIIIIIMKNARCSCCRSSGMFTIIAVFSCFATNSSILILDYLFPRSYSHDSLDSGWCIVAGCGSWR